MSWLPGASLKWAPVFKALVESKEYIIIGLMSVELPLRGRVLATPFTEQGFFELETAVTTTDRETGNIVETIPAVTMFHVDDIGWITRLPPDFDVKKAEAKIGDGALSSALTDEEKRNLGLVE